MIVLAGPYVGSFEHEILTFRPYVRWLVEVSEEKIYVSTHFNRFFLYQKFIQDDYLLPVFENLTRDEINQSGYVHKTVKQRDYNIIIKNAKDLIVDREKCNKKDIEICNISYVKSTPPQSIYNKLFSRIEDYFDIENPYKDKIIFIPANTDFKDRLSKVRKFLNNYENIVTVGDKKTRFRDDNVLLKRIDYVENGWKLIIRIISEARAVICPISHWTTICNLQRVPVFSWGENVGQHRLDGIYNFGNKDCITIASDRIEIIQSMIANFLEKVR